MISRMKTLPSKVIFLVPVLVLLQMTRSLNAEESSQWSNWSGWSKCPSGCGQGISERNRFCQKGPYNQPTESGNCPGSDIQRRLCLNSKCPKSGPSPRQQACSKYDNRVFSGKQYVWEPFVHLSDPCKLSCRAKDAHFYANLAERVQDGVKCGQNGVLAVCIKGSCQPVGCDNIVLSTARRDKCGQCGGKGTTCKTISGIFTSTQLTRGLNHVLTIPHGSTGINITELMPSKNMLVLQTLTGKVFINPNEVSPLSGTIEAAGTIFKYSPKTSISPKESIVADGPTNITLVLKVLSRGSNPGIIYTFSVPQNVSESYMQQITGHSVNPLSMQAAPVYIENDDTPKSIPHENDVNQENSLPSRVENNPDTLLDNNSEDSYHTRNQEITETKTGSKEQVLVPSDESLDQSIFTSPENISLNTSNIVQENLQNRSVSQSTSNVSTHTALESSDTAEQNISEDVQDGDLDDQNFESILDFSIETDEDTEDNDKIIEENTKKNSPDPTVKSTENKKDNLDLDNTLPTKKETTTLPSIRRYSSSETILANHNHSSPETPILDESQESSSISEGVDDIIDDLETFQTSTLKPPGDFINSVRGSKRYKIPKYSQSFTFAEKYQKRKRRRNRRRHSRRGHSSREGEDRNDGGYSSRRRPVISQAPSFVGDDKDFDTFDDQQLSSGQQLPYSRNRPEPRGDETSALESRPVTFRRYRYYGQRHNNDRGSSDRRNNESDRMRSLRERQARIQERHRRLREQREEYNRRLRDRHERQLKRRWHRTHGRNSSQSSSQRYTRVTVRSRTDSPSSYRNRFSPLETTTVVNVPSSSRVGGYLGQRTGLSSRDSLESRDRDSSVTEGRRYPVRIQSKPVRIIPNDARSGNEELVSRVSGSFSGNSLERDPSSPEHYVKTTMSQQLQATSGLRFEDTTTSFSHGKTENNNLFGDIPYKNTASSTGDRGNFPLNPNSRRLIARVRSNQTNVPQVRRRPHPAQVSSRENGIPPHVIPSTGTGHDNVIIPNTKLRADQYQPDLIPNRQIPTNKIIGFTSYEWRISGLTECTHSCGGGVQQTVVVCVAERTQAVVTDENCADVQKPELKAVSCNKRPCPAQWISSPWSACSVTCDEGIQTRSLYCQARVSPTLNLTMPVDSCEHLDKPEETQSCRPMSCNTWKVGNWSECSANCGDGVKSRTVQCLDVNQQIVADDQCADLKPNDEKECNQGSCGKGWFVTQWPKECPVQCGKGELVRKVFCASDEGDALPESRCDANQRPRTHRPCRVETPCGGFWFAGEWSKCNTTCGKGWRVREILCVKKVPGNLYAVVEEENCLNEQKPKAVESCILPDCEPEWYMTSWGQCSQTCETGYRTREIKCLSQQQAPSDRCPIDTRPRIREPCNTESCAVNSSEDTLSKDSDTSCTDKYVQCRIAKRARLCRYGYYKKMCCKACSGES